MSKITDVKSALPPKYPILYFQIGVWFLVAIVVSLAFSAWGSDHRSNLTSITAYTLFPLLGLLAYSLMWTHYVASILQKYAHLHTSAYKSYFQTTSWLVLVLICLHPSILIFQRFRDGYGLPPKSYESYVAPGLGWVTLLGTTSLLVFLAYELHRYFGNKSWFRYIKYASDAAMLAIFYHALRLGTQIHGWFRVIWWVYGITLTVILIDKYISKIVAHQAK